MDGAIFAVAGLIAALMLRAPAPGEPSSLCSKAQRAALKKVQTLSNMIVSPIRLAPPRITPVPPARRATPATPPRTQP